MKIDIDTDTAENIALTVLEDNYENNVDSLIKILETDEVEGLFSFNYDEEIFRLIDLINSIGVSLKYFGGSNKSLDNILLEYNKELYKSVKSFEEMKESKEDWQGKFLALEDDYNLLKDKIGSILN